MIFREQLSTLASPAQAQQATEKTNAILTDLSIPQDSLIHRYKWTSQGFAGHFSKEQVEKLRADPRIEHVVNDLYYKAISIASSSEAKSASKSTNSSQTTPWGITRVDGPLDGTGKTAWILDTGIDLDHPDLNVNTSASASFVASESADDLNGHGSHVSGIVAAVDNSRDVVGVAAGASVVAVKVCDQGGFCYVSDVKAGVEYVGNNFSQGDVANLSLGYPTDDPDLPSIDIPLSDLENAISSAADGGLKFSIAAGNDSDDANNYSPARMERSNVWTVSAYDDTDTFASFSNFGNPPIEFGGPGVDVPSLWKDGGTNTISGTSMAAPHIAGLLLAAPGIATEGTVSNDPDGDPDPIAVVGNPPSVSISGPDQLLQGQQGTWTADITGGISPFDYQWEADDDPIGTNSDEVSHSFSEPGTHEIEVQITDAQGRTDTDVMLVEVQGEIGGEF